MDWFTQANDLGFGQVHLHIDPKTGLQAVIAVHSVQRGPAIGGCRCLPYPTVDAAITDALRLAQMMTYKSAIMDLPHGGAKAVCLAPETIPNRQAYFEAFGDFVHQLNGQYITAVDSGTHCQDMDVIATRTPHVLCQTQQDHTQQAAYHTALGVFQAMMAALKHTKNTESFEGIHVAIQGCGQVGWYLLQRLHEHQAHITVSDTRDEALERCRNLPRVRVVSPEVIHQTPADIFSPCALGGVLNAHSIQAIQAPIVVGAANNQLQCPEDAHHLWRRGLLYIPDFLANAGGLSYAAGQYGNCTPDAIKAKTLGIYGRVLAILQQSEQTALSPDQVARQIAEQNIHA